MRKRPFQRSHIIVQQWSLFQYSIDNELVNILWDLQWVFIDRIDILIEIFHMHSIDANFSINDH